MRLTRARQRARAKWCETACQVSREVINSYSQRRKERFPNETNDAWHCPAFAGKCGMLAEFAQHISKTLEEIKAQGLYKTERVITGPQNAEIPIADGRRVINLCANNYLGLADHPALIAAAKEALDTHGFGMASVRFFCGTADFSKHC